MKLRQMVVWGAVILALGAVVYAGWQRQQTEMAGDGVSVVASFYPLAEFARQAGGEAAQVTTVVPSDAEPHEYEPTPQEVAKVYTADLFIYNGSGLDPWAERIAPDLIQKGIRGIHMSQLMPLLAGTGEAHEEGDEQAEEEASEYDPHFWLDPVLAQQQVEAIRDALVAVDPAHAADYKNNSDAYGAELRQLDQDYRQGLQSCARRDIVTSHAAFGYLAKRYGLSVTTIAGLSTEEEPSARRLSEIAQLAREKNIQYIFFETLVSPRLAQTVAAEIGAQTLVFNPIEGLTDNEQADGQDYLSVMRENLQNLRRALECK